MKYIIPYRMYAGQPYDSPFVTGGTEMFIRRFLASAKHPVEVICFTESEWSNRNHVIKSIARAITSRTDVIVSNYIIPKVSSDLAKIVTVNPIVVLIHNIASSWTADSFLKTLETAPHKNLRFGFVSEFQFNDWYKFAKRRLRTPISRDQSFFFYPWFYSDNDHEGNYDTYDIVTIGRAQYHKDPLAVHKIGKRTNLHSCAIISTMNMDDKYKKMYEDYRASHPNATVYENIPHSENLGILLKSRTYLSTCAVEAWGITMAEACCAGLPVIAFQYTGQNPAASEFIHENFLRVIDRKTNSIDIQNAFKYNCTIPNNEIRSWAKEHFTVETFRQKLFTNI